MGQPAPCCMGPFLTVVPTTQAGTDPRRKEEKGVRQSRCPAGHQLLKPAARPLLGYGARSAGSPGRPHWHHLVFSHSRPGAPRCQSPRHRADPRRVRRHQPGGGAEGTQQGAGPPAEGPSAQRLRGGWWVGGAGGRGSSGCWRGGCVLGGGPGRERLGGSRVQVSRKPSLASRGFGHPGSSGGGLSRGPGAGRQAFAHPTRGPGAGGPGACGRDTPRPSGQGG